MKKKYYFFLIITVLFASLMCVLLNNKNNKYTSIATQPENGLLMLSEQELDTHPIRFLTKEWGFYPEVLLSPDDFKDGAPLQYMTYMDIGDYTCFPSLTDKDQPHGCGTYVLYLKLPNQPMSLMLPEIFSAYRLYINDDLVLQTGDPDINTYQPLTQNRTIHFQAEGTIRLILAVSDYSHYYSGMVYPPVLGTSQSILKYQDIRIALCASGISGALIIAVLFLYMGIHLKQRNALYFASLCASMIVFTSYPLLHTLWKLPLFPWYTLELGSGYLVIVLIILLHNRICGTHPVLSCISQGTALFFFSASLVYGTCAPWLTISIMRFCSVCICAYKLIAAAYLLYTSFMTLLQKDPSIQLLFYGDVFYGAVLLWDRLLPKYEPVYGGWFSEWGCLILMLVILYTLISDIAQTYTLRLAFAEEKKQLARQLAIQQEHYRELNEKVEESIQRRHDERHHLMTISSLLEDRKLEQLEKYLADYQISYDHTERTVICRNLTIDAILQYYQKRCKQSGISLFIHAQIPPQLSIADTDLAILYGNLMENALEACMKQTSGNRFIHVVTSCQENRLLLRIENSFAIIPHISNNKFLSDKHDGYGIGTESVKALAQRYQGQFKFDVTQERFQISIILKCNASSL